MRPRVAIAVLALAFFFLPVALRVGGVTARPFENRPFVAFPKASQGWSGLDQAVRFLVERLPLREQAVRADAWASVHVFKTPADNGQSVARKGALPFERPAQAATARQLQQGQAIPAQGQPGSTVLVGRDGWLYLEDELARACNLFIAWPAAMRRWERLTSIIRASGRRVVLVVAPDKSTIYPEHLPGSFPERDCAPPGRRATWRAVEGARDPAVLGLRRTLSDAKHGGEGELYYPKDTHWNTAGAVLGVQAVLARLGGPPLRPEEVVKRRKWYTGDLTNLIGASQQARAPWWIVRRPGVPPVTKSRQTWPGHGTGRLLQRGSGGPPELGGRTLFLSDSFGRAMRDPLSAYTRSLSIMLWYGGEQPSAIVDAIKGSDTVILETAERDLNFKASDGGFLSLRFLATVARALGVR